MAAGHAVIGDEINAVGRRDGLQRSSLEFRRANDDHKRGRLCHKHASLWRKHGRLRHKHASFRASVAHFDASFRKNRPILESSSQKRLPERAVVAGLPTVPFCSTDGLQCCDQLGDLRSRNVRGQETAAQRGMVRPHP